jgi:hypothetical protein
LTVLARRFALDWIPVPMNRISSSDEILEISAKSCPIDAPWTISGAKPTFQQH